MPRRSLALIGLVLMLLGAVPSVSLAHNVSVGTKVSSAKLPRGRLDRGQRVIIFGRVGAIDPVCNAAVNVELLRRVPGADRVLQSDTANATGKYYFLRRARTDQRLYVRFAGFQDIVAGHSHTCAASVSKQFRIRVNR